MAHRRWYLTRQFALKDFKIRYTSTALGYAWSVLNPLVFALLYYLVFSIFARFDIPNYPAYLILGVVLWNFFSEATANGIASLLAQSSIVTKVALPRDVIVYAAILNAMLTLAITLGAMAVVLALSHIPLTWAALGFPIVLVDLVVLALGVALLLAPLHVRFHDVGYLWGIALQIGFWLTPIIYHDLMLPPRWRRLMRFNPMARLIGHGRDALILNHAPDWDALARTTVMVLAILGVGMFSFRRLQARLVEYY